MRVLFAGGGTGGHLYPALAIARALVRLMPRAEPFFIGARRGIERDILPTTEFPHLLLDLHPLYRTAPWKNVRTVAGLASSLRALGQLSRAQAPALTVATGGYASGAALAWSRWRGVPYVLQEQNACAGKTVRWFSAAARELYLGFGEAANGLPTAARIRAVDTGNPIEPPPPAATRPPRDEARTAWGFPPGVSRVLLVFGGSQGSAALNAVVDAWVGGGVPRGLGVIWATGRDHVARHAGRASDCVKVHDYLSPIAKAYGAADVALTRAGAMTTAELCAWGIPMVLVPLPTAAADHQTVNARALAAAGAARWLPQGELTVGRLRETLDSLLQDEGTLSALAAGAQRRARPGAAQVIAQRVAALLVAGGV